jgi:hypothetical protein
MTIRTTYPPANIVAPTVEQHFIRQITEARQQGETELAPQPDAATIEAIIDATFWATSWRKVGFKISLAYLSPEQAGQPLLLARPLR